jgi:hypothetical protein
MAPVAARTRLPVRRATAVARLLLGARMSCIIDKGRVDRQPLDAMCRQPSGIEPQFIDVFESGER